MSITLGDSIYLLIVGITCTVLGHLTEDKIMTGFGIGVAMTVCLYNVPNIVQWTIRK